jgi:hypothetical protein
VWAPGGARGGKFSHFGKIFSSARILDGVTENASRAKILDNVTKNTSGARILDDGAKKPLGPESLVR